MAINTQKFLPAGKKGGDIVTQPSSELVKPLYTISVKIITVEKLLQGSFAAKKKQQDDEKKAKEKEARAKEEDKVEGPIDPDKPETPKQLIPKMSFLSGIKKFLGDILIGWIAFRLIKFLPTIVKFLKPLAAIADFVIDFGGKILNGLATFLEWGMKIHDWTREKVRDIFGDEGVEKFDNFTSVLNKFMNTVMILGMTAAAVAMEVANMKGDNFWDDVRGKPKPKPGQGISPDGKYKQVRKKNIVDPSDGSIRPKTKTENLLQKQGLNDDQIRAYNKARQGGAGANDALKQAKKVKPQPVKTNWFKKALTGVGDFADKTLAQAGQLAGEGWKKVKNVGKGLKSKWDNAAKKVTNSLDSMKKGARDALLNGVVAPIKKWLDPIIRPLGRVADDLFKNILKIPGVGDLLKKIGLNALSDAPKLASKFGAKALPWIGGIFNMLFAYDRLASGDSFGAMLEFGSGILDITGLAPASMAIDAYLFGRDLFPETVMGGEKAVLGMIPGAMALGSKIDAIGSKLPDLGELVKMLTGGDKKEKDPNKVPASTDKSTSTTDVDVDPSQKDDIVISKETSPAGSEKIMPLDVKAVSKKTEDISKHASYEMVGDEEGSQEAYNAGYSDGLDASGELPEPKSKESLVPIVVAGGSRFHSSTDSLYAGG